MLEPVFATSDIPPTHHDCKRHVWLAILTTGQREVAGLTPAPGYLATRKVPGKINASKLPCVTGGQCHLCGDFFNQFTTPYSGVNPRPFGV